MIRRKPLSRIHLLAASVLAVAIAVWIALMLVATRDAERAAEGAGLVTVLFPLGTTIKDVFLATDRAGGSIVSDTWFPNVWVLHSAHAGYAGRLRDSGALLVVDAAPFRSITIPTCGGV